MSDKSWISRLFGRGNKEDSSPRSSASNSPLSRSPRLLSDANTRMQESSAGVNGCLSGTSPPTSSRNVMYFSPESALGQRTDMTSSVFNTRKRQLTDFGSPESNVLASARVKRFREGLGNSSLMEAPEKSTLGPRLDATWAPGQMSPASSNQSLRSRISLASTVHTNLSSKTRAILEKLEKVSSPATVVMRMPFPKSSNSGPERWAPSANGSNNSSVRSFGSASGAPPLRRQTLNAPSRLEVLSSSTAPLYKKPYWRDLSRSQIKPSVVDGAVGTPSKDVQRVQSSQPVKVSPLFDLSVGSPALKESEKLPESEPVRRHLPPVKGSDGKSTRNTFNANELYEEDGADETDAAWLNKSAALPAFSFAAPTKGFLDEKIENGVFEFAPPIKRGPKAPSPSSSEESSAGESSESDSGSGSDEESELSEHSEKQAGAQVEVPAKTGDKITVPVLEKRSQSAITTADSETSASNVPTPASSKNASPQGGAGGSSSSTIAPWDCPECFISNSLGTPKCVACGFVKDKAAAASAPVFGSSAFKATPTTTSTFAFGVSKPSDADKNKDSSSQPQGSSNAADSEKTEMRQPWFCPDCYITNKDSDDKCIACGHAMYKSAPAAAVERKSWDCPDCFVNNKATDDKCMACGHEMYKSADASAKPTSVFGDKAFKPVAPPSGVSFGFGGKSASTSSNASTASTVSFGIGASKPSGEKEAAAKPLFGFGSSGTTASTIPSFGVPLSTITEEAKKTEEPKTSAPSTGASSLFTSAADAVPKAAAPSVFQGFGAVTSNSALSTAASAPSLSIFGTAATSIKPLTSTTTTTTTTSSSTSTAAPLSVFAFPAGAATSQRSPFPATATTTSTPSSTAPAPLFGSGVAATSSTTNIFGASDPATSASTTVSSSVPLFGASTITSASTATTATAPLFGASATGAGGLFGASKPMFGSGASVPATTASSGSIFEAPSAKRPFAFGSTESATSQPSATGLFGSSSDKPAFGAAPAAGSMFGSNVTSSASTTTAFTFGAPAAQPQQPAPATNGGFNFAPTTQTNNMFGSSAASVPTFGAPTEPPAAFNFGGAAAPSTGTFQFGASAPAAGGQPFVFGQSAPAPAAPSFPSFNATAAAPNPSPFGFGAPQESTTDPSPFAYGANPSTSGRKMAQARRRLTRRT